MRICLYTCTALPKLGGQQAVVDALARQFLAAGHEPYVLAPRPRWPMRCDDASLPYPVLRHPRFISTRHLVAWYRRWLIKYHRQHRFDVLHCHDVYPSGYLAALSQRHLLSSHFQSAIGNRQSAIPFIITSHGGDLREGNTRLVKPGLAARFQQAIQSADALISIGKFTHDGFIRLGGDEHRIVPIPNGVDLEPFAHLVDRPVDISPAISPGKYLLFLGRLAKRKGVDLLLQALHQADAGIQLVIAGSGNEQAELEKLVDQLNLRRQVELVGRVAGTSKTWLLQNARCTVMPSRDWEAFPLVVLESHAAGRPVIASDIPGLQDVVQNQITGLLVKPESPADWATAIRRAMTDDAWIAAAGQAARQSAAKYAWQTIAQRHLDLYAQLMKKSRHIIQP